MHILLAVITIVLIASGCSGPDNLTINDLHNLQKGITRAEVRKLLKFEPKNQRQFFSEGRRYTIEYFELITSTGKSSTTMPNGTTMRNGIAMPNGITTSSSEDVTNPLLLLYDENEKLRYWGLAQDYQKSEDPEMQRLATNIY